MKKAKKHQNWLLEKQTFSHIPQVSPTVPQVSPTVPQVSPTVPQVSPTVPPRLCQLPSGVFHTPPIFWGSGK